MPRLASCSIPLLVLTTGAPAASALERLAVMPIAAQRLPADVARILDEVLLAEAVATQQFQVIGASDIEALLGLEKMKDALACDDVACAAEIGGALGVRLLLSVQLGVLGDELVATGKLIDVASSEVRGRATLSADNDERRYKATVQQLARKLLLDAGAGPSGAAGRGQAIGLESFLGAGLTVGDYEDWSSSGLAYRVWAAQRNEESWLLELTKWGISSMVPLLLLVGIGMLADDDERFASSGKFMLGMAGFYGLAAGGVWLFDLSDYDAVPPEL